MDVMNGQPQGADHESGEGHVPDLRAVARAMHEAGMCPVPVSENGSKTPDLRSWIPYKTVQSSPDEHDAWFGPSRRGTKRTGIGVVYGTVSGNLELIEFEGRAIAEGLLDQAADIFEASGLGDLWHAITTGWVDESPSGGKHFRIRVEGCPVKGNTKLASRPAREDELTDEERARRLKNPNAKIVRVQVETRGEGGFGVTAPSHGKVHPSGRPYVRVAGDPSTVPVVDAELYDAVHIILRMLDTLPVEEPPSPERDPQPSNADGELRPGDDFNERGSWAEILRDHMREVFRRGQTTYWCREGKRAGVSATTGHASDKDRIYVFSTSTAFEAERPYTKFAAYALLEHNNDFKAATKELARLGYGAPRRGLHALPSPRVSARPLTDGTAALQVDPMDEPWPDEEPVEDEVLPEVGDPIPFNDTQRSWDDLGNGARLLDRYAPIIRWVLLEKGGRWTVYDGKRWDFEGGDTLVRTLGRKTIESLPDGEALKYSEEPTTDPVTGKPKPSDRDRFKAFIHSSRDHRSISRSAAAASTFPRIHARANDFDADRRFLNLPNGVLDTDEVRLIPHQSALMLSRMLATPYNARATAPTWLKFLKENIPDEATRHYLQKAAGYSLSGLSSEKCLLYLHGPSDTGKSIFAGVMLKLFGTDYAVAAADGTLRPRREGTISNDIDDMAGKRFVTTSESRPGESMDEALVKRLTGRDPQRTRKLHSNNRTWVPECVIWVCSNQYPKITGDDDAIWTRIKVVPFTVQFLRGDPRRDEHLDAKIGRELPGVLAWAVEGLRMYLREGLTPPPEVVMASETFRSSSDGVTKFLTEAVEDNKLVVDPAAWIERATLHQKYKAWCEEDEQEALKPARFYVRLESLGYKPAKRAGNRGFGGIGVPERARSSR